MQGGKKHVQEMEQRDLKKPANQLEVDTKIPEKKATKESTKVT